MSYLGRTSRDDSRSNSVVTPYTAAMNRSAPTRNARFAESGASLEPQRQTTAADTMSATTMTGPIQARTVVTSYSSPCTPKKPGKDRYSITCIRVASGANAMITLRPSAAGPRKSAAPSAVPAFPASRAPGASSGARTSGTVFASTPTPSRRQPHSQKTTSRDRQCAMSAATASVTRRPTLMSLFPCWQTRSIATGLRAIPTSSARRTASRLAPTETSVRYSVATSADSARIR